MEVSGRGLDQFKEQAVADAQAFLRDYGARNSTIQRELRDVLRRALEDQSAGVGDIEVFKAVAERAESLLSAHARHKATEEEREHDVNNRELGDGPTAWFHDRAKPARASAGFPMPDREHGVAETLDRVADHFDGDVPGGLFAPRDTSECCQRVFLAAAPPTTATAPDTDVEEEELLRRLGHTKARRAPGPDGIPYEYYRAFPALMKPLANIFTAAMDGQELPPSMLDGLIILIFKKGNAHVVGNYRPITLLNCDAKLGMGIVQDRLTKWILKSGCVTEEQMGFVLGRQITDALITVLDAMHFACEVDVQVALVSVDWAGAYDRVDRDWMTRCLRHYGVGPRLLCLIQLFHTGARCRVLVEGWLSRSFRVLSGVRQGDPAAPLIFVITLQPLVALLSRNWLLRLRGAPVPTGKLARWPSWRGWRSWHRYPAIERRIISTVTYADDSSFLALTVIGIVYLYCWLEVWAWGTGAKLNAQKSWVMRRRAIGIADLPFGMMTIIIVMAYFVLATPRSLALTGLVTMVLMVVIIVWIGNQTPRGFGRSIIWREALREVTPMPLYITIATTSVATAFHFSLSNVLFSTLGVIIMFLIGTFAVLRLFAHVPRGEKLRLLGIYLTADGIVGIDEEAAMAEISAVFTRWAGMGLTQFGRIHVANSEALSQLWYKLTLNSLSTGPTRASEFYGKLKKLVAGYVFHAMAARTIPSGWSVPYEVLTSPRRGMGGGGLLDAQKHVAAIQIASVVKWARFAQTGEDSSSPGPLWMPYATYWFNVMTRDRDDTLSPRAQLELLASGTVTEEQINAAPIPTIWQMRMTHWMLLAPRTAQGQSESETTPPQLQTPPLTTDHMEPQPPRHVLTLDLDDQVEPSQISSPEPSQQEHHEMHPRLRHDLADPTTPLNQPQLHDLVMVYFDGAAPDNGVQGRGGVAKLAGSGFVVLSTEGTILTEGSYTLWAGTTNTQAEYDGFLSGVTAGASLLTPTGTMDVRGDSMLVLHQANGTWRVNSRNIIRLADKARKLWEPFGRRGGTLQHVFRENNKYADDLASKAAAGHPISGRGPRSVSNGPAFRGIQVFETGEDDTSGGTSIGWEVCIRGAWKPLTYPCVVRVARQTLQQVTAASPRRWAAVRNLRWPVIWRNLDSAILSSAHRSLTWELLHGNRPMHRFDEATVYCPYFGAPAVASTPHMLECPWVAPGRHWLEQQLSSWAEGTIILTTAVLLGSKEPETVRGMPTHVRRHWHTLRCLTLVAIWQTYKTHLPSLNAVGVYVSAAQRAREMGQGDAYRQVLGSRVVRKFAALFDSELDFAWRRALCGVTQELRGGGARIRGGGGAIRLAETWGRNGVFATAFRADSSGTDFTVASRTHLMTAGIFLGIRTAGWRVLDISNDIPTVIMSLLNTGRRCEQYNLVGGDNNARHIGTNITERLEQECGCNLNQERSRSKMGSLATTLTSRRR